VSTKLQGWKPEEPLFDGRYEWRIHPCPKRLDQLWGAQPASYSAGTADCFPKRKDIEE